MSFATTNQTGLYVTAESVWGTTPATPNLQELRYTGESVNYEIENVTSDEIRSDRMTSDTVQVGQTTSGGIDFELSYGSYDGLMESALYRAFSTANGVGAVNTLTAGATGSGLDFAFNTGGTITLGASVVSTFVAGQRIQVAGASTASNNAMYNILDVTGQVLTVSPAPAATVTEQATTQLIGSRNYIAAGATADTLDIVTNTAGTITLGAAHSHNIVAGQWILAGGFTASNLNGVYHRVVSVAGNVLTVSPVPATTETNQTSGWISGSVLRNAPDAASIVQKSYTLQKRFNDATAVTYQNLAGMIADTMSLSFETGSILTGSFGFMGKGSEIGTSQIAGAVDIDATTTDVMNSVSNLQNIEFDDTDTTACLVSMSLETTGNLRAQNCIGSLAAVGVGTGRLEITGDVTLFFENITEYNKFLNNTSFKVSFRVQDVYNNAYVITLPKVKYEGMTMNSGGLDGEVELSGTYRALLGTTAGVNYMIEIDRLPATVA
jgi:hypothetical protein